MGEMYFDGVPVCDDCGGGLCLARLSECNNPDHRDLDLLPPFTPSDPPYEPFYVDGFQSDVEHTWHNIYASDRVYYDCKCGEHFDTHAELMKHTAELNPKLDTLTMGRAGAALEREAHTKTIDLLRRARAILLMTDDVADESVSTLLDDINEHCQIFVEEDE